MYRQFLLSAPALSTETGPRTTQMRTWLDDDPRLKIGARLTLKRDGTPLREWTVEERSEMTLDRPPTQRWQVGGLS